jgi:quinoprotein glucose dehydrogenase
MVDGVLYSTAGTRRAVVALDAGTGELIWMHSENEGKRGESAPRQLSGRGLSYWPGSGSEGARIVYVTPGYRMIALDAKTGNLVAGFGKSGVVDLKDEDDQPVDPITGDIGLHATPVISKDIIVVGAAHLPGGVPKSRIHEKGFVRSYDARTGKRLWIFHTIPLAGDGNDTWERDSWSLWQHRRLGTDDRRQKRPTRCSCRWRCRPATTTAVTVRAPASSATAWSRSI